MKSTKRLTLFTAFLGLSLAAGTARAADSVHIVSMAPASPASLPGVPTGGSLGAGNSIEIAFTYNLETHANARIGFYTAGEAGNPAHTGVELPFIVTKKGQGKGTTRISVQCNGKYTSCHIVNLRYDMFFDAPSPAPLVKLFEDHKVVDYTFKCPDTGNPTGGNPTPTPAGKGGDAKKPNITFGRNGIYIWGANPATKQWVNFGSVVKLSAADAINPHPSPGNGTCAFNVEYYEKEANGVATGPFTNKIYSDANVRAVNGPFGLAASEEKALTTQPYLDPGAHGLKIVLDDGNVQPETNEGDNSNSLRYILDGKCTSLSTVGGPPK